MAVIANQIWQVVYDSLLRILFRLLCWLRILLWSIIQFCWALLVLNSILDRDLKSIGTGFEPLSIARLHLFLKELVKRRRRHVIVLWSETYVEVVAKFAFTAFIVHKILDRTCKVGWGGSQTQILRRVRQSQNLPARS